MLTLLGSLLGFLSALAPRAFDYYQERADRAHELSIIDRQMEQMRLGSHLKLEEINAKADVAQSKAIYRHDSSIKASTFIDNLRGSVRPVITYLLVATFIAIKGAGLYALIVIEGMAVYQALPLIGDDQFNSLLAAIISFWFGSRAMARK
jgi:hypothetical protein